MKVRDQQRKKLYDWEEAAAERDEYRCEPMSLAEIEQLGSRIWSDYKFSHAAPEVKDGRGRRRANGSMFAVSFPTWTRNLQSALHEYAHAITFGEVGRYHEIHGPAFVRIYIELLVRYADGYLPVLLGSAKGGRLRVRQLPFLLRLERSSL